jgi:hypothetical protein
MAVLLLRCFVDASLRHAGRPLAAWLREVGSQAGALVTQVECGTDLAGQGTFNCLTLWDLTLRAAEVRIQATPQQCAFISGRIAREKVPVFLMKVLGTEQSTFFAPA